MKYKNGIVIIFVFFIFAVIVFIGWKTMKEGFNELGSLPEDVKSIQHDVKSFLSKGSEGTIPKFLKSLQEGVLKEGFDDPDQATIDLCTKIRDDFVSKLASNVASIQLQQLNYPAEDQIQTDLSTLVQDIPFPPILNQEYLLQYYESLTNAVSNGLNGSGSSLSGSITTNPKTGSSVSGSNTSLSKTFLKINVPTYVAQVSKQMPYYIQSVVDKTISDYDSTMQQYISQSKPSYSSTL